jgi:histidinol-phosphate aminotransferase
MITIPEHLEKLQPYKAGKPIAELKREKGLTTIVKLASNENPLGPSPKAIQAIKEQLDQLHRYPDPLGFGLIERLAEHYNKKPDQIICSNGSDSLIQYIVAAFTGDGVLLTSAGSFIGIYVNTNKLGKRIHSVPLTDTYEIDLETIAESITDETTVIYLANPNNPTGTMFTTEQFERFYAKVPDNVLVVLDEAYTVFAQDFENYPNGLQYDYENLLVLRTFSKDYGLAGLRVGVAVGPSKLIGALYKIRLPFDPNLLSHAAVLGALDDEEFIEKTRKVNRESLAAFRAAFDKLGINYTHSAANFLMLIFADSDTALKFTSECLDRGLILRHLPGFGIPNGVRINSGTKEETDFAIEVITEVIKEL